MTDKERREDDALKKLIQTAYDFSDEQLLADLEEVEATLSDSDFPGIEERMYRKLKARLDEEEAQNHLETASEEALTTILPVEEKKVVRFGKKKVLVVGILAAAFVGMLGVTAIGGKNYFFRKADVPREVIINNDKNIEYFGDINDAYKKIEEIFEFRAIKLQYIPTEMLFEGMETTENRVILLFSYNDKPVYFMQEQKFQSTSVGINSDRNLSVESIQNKWLDKNINLEEEILQDGKAGYAVYFNNENARYRLFGQISKEEIIKIAKNMNYQE